MRKGGKTRSLLVQNDAAFQKNQFMSLSSPVSNLWMKYQHTFYLFDFRFILEQITITDIVIYLLEFFKVSLITNLPILQKMLCKLPTADNAAQTTTLL